MQHRVRKTIKTEWKFRFIKQSMNGVSRRNEMYSTSLDDYCMATDSIDLIDNTIAQLKKDPVVRTIATRPNTTLISRGDVNLEVERRAVIILWFRNEWNGRGACHKLKLQLKHAIFVRDVSERDVPRSWNNHGWTVMYHIFNFVSVRTPSHSDAAQLIECYDAAQVQMYLLIFLIEKNHPIQMNFIILWK